MDILPLALSFIVWTAKFEISRLQNDPSEEVCVHGSEMK